MKQRINVLTIGVYDLKKSLTFYRDGLGFQTKGVTGEEFEHGAVVFFDLTNGMKLALWERKNLAWDTGLQLQPASSTEFSMGHLVNTDKEVDEVIEQAGKAGATIVKPAAKTFWGGYAGYFKDPDGHL